MRDSDPDGDGGFKSVIGKVSIRQIKRLEVEIKENDKEFLKRKKLELKQDSKNRRGILCQF